MKRLVLTIAALGAATSMAACSQKDSATAEATPPADMAATSVEPASNSAGMSMAAGAKIAKGTGTVTAVSADSVTIDHAPIPEAGWPAMTMGFKASPDLASKVKVGDKVAFDLRIEGGAGDITAINKQ